MNQRVQQKIQQLKKMSGAANVHPVATRKAASSDGLSLAIHSKKDAENFMAELKAAVKQSK